MAYEKGLNLFKKKMTAVLVKSGEHVAKYYKDAIEKADTVNGHPDLTVEDALRMIDVAVNEVRLKIKNPKKRKL